MEKKLVLNKQSHRILKYNNLYLFIYMKKFLIQHCVWESFLFCCVHNSLESIGRFQAK